MKFLNNALNSSNVIVILLKKMLSRDIFTIPSKLKTIFIRKLSKSIKRNDGKRNINITINIEFIFFECILLSNENIIKYNKHIYFPVSYGMIFTLSILCIISIDGRNNNKFRRIFKLNNL